MYKYLFETLFLIFRVFFGIRLKVELLDHLEILGLFFFFFFFCGNTRLFSIVVVAAPLFIHINSASVSLYLHQHLLFLVTFGFQVVLVVKNLPAKAGDLKAQGPIRELGSPPGVGNGYPLQYSYLENPMDRGVWWTTRLFGSQRVRHD